MEDSLDLKITEPRPSNEGEVLSEPTGGPAPEGDKLGKGARRGNETASSRSSTSKVYSVSPL